MMPEARLPPRSRTQARLLVAALLLGAAPTAASAADSLFDRGKSHWLARRYPPARDTLLTYRREVNAKKPHLDYMLGTSGCRIAEQRRWGGNVLDFILYRYQLTPRSRRIIERERSLCRLPAAMPLLSAEEVQLAVGALAGATSQGKMGYVVNASEPVAAFSAHSIGPADEAALRRRLVPIGSVDRMQSELSAVAPAGSRISIRGRYAFVTSAGQTDAELAVIQADLDRYLAFLETEYDLRLPENYLTLYLVRRQEDLTALARELHRLQVSPATIGYTFQDDQSAVAIIPGTQIGTLLHELFHLVVRTSFGDIPQWLDEGLASLYEVAAFEEARVVGLPNWRGPVLEELWTRRPPLQDVIGAAWFASDTPGQQDGEVSESLLRDQGEVSRTLAAQFATARYFMVYLQKLGKLRDVYREVQRLEPGDSDDPRRAVLDAVSRQLGPLDEVQRSFDEWFQRTKGRDGFSPSGRVVEKFEPGRRPKPPCAPTNVIQQTTC
jgi:hypothetical protein